MYSRWCIGVWRVYRANRLKDAHKWNRLLWKISCIPVDSRCSSQLGIKPKGYASLHQEDDEKQKVLRWFVSLFFKDSLICLGGIAIRSSIWYPSCFLALSKKKKAPHLWVGGFVVCLWILMARRHVYARYGVKYFYWLWFRLICGFSWWPSPHPFCFIYFIAKTPHRHAPHQPSCFFRGGVMSSSRRKKSIVNGAQQNPFVLFFCISSKKCRLFSFERFLIKCNGTYLYIRTYVRWMEERQRLRESRKNLQDLQVNQSQ